MKKICLRDDMQNKAKKNIAVLSFLLKTFILMLLVYCIPSLRAQEIDINKSTNQFEIKIGAELHRRALVLGLGWNIYFAQHSILSPEINLVGGPWFCGTYSYEINLNPKMKLLPQIGVGLLPFPISATSFIVGLNYAYKINSKNNLFIESRIYFVNNDKLQALGKGISGIENIYEQKPLNLSIGITF